MDDKIINLLAAEMMLLCVEISNDVNKVKGHGMAVTALHALFENKIREVLEVD
jgi:hypothetical protein